MPYREGDIVRHTAPQERSKEGVFVRYYGDTNYALVCWVDVDPAMMRACGRKIKVKWLAPTGKRHFAYKLLRDNHGGET